MAAIACWLNVIENVALIGLTFISSAENHGKCINQNSSITLPWYYRTLHKYTCTNTSQHQNLCDVLLDMLTQW